MVKTKQERWLALCALSRDLDTKGNPKARCFVWWSKHSLDTKVTGFDTFAPDILTYLRTPQRGACEALTDYGTLQGFGHFGGAS